MALSSRRKPFGWNGTVLPDWSTDPICVQHRLAEQPPNLYPLLQETISRAGRGSMQVALDRLFLLIDAHTDLYAADSAALVGLDLAEIRAQIYRRRDFDPRMLFTLLTYFGPAGVAINNALIEKVPSFMEALGAAAREGGLDD